MKRSLSLILALVMLIGLMPQITLPVRAAESIVEFDIENLHFDDHVDMTGKVVEIIDAGTPTSYQVGYGVEENKVLDTAVVTLKGDTLVATGIGTAKVKIDGVLYEVTVEAAPISLLLLIGQSNMRGSEGNADQSIVCPDGMVYATFGDDRGDAEGIMNVNNATKFAASALTGPYSTINVEGTTEHLSYYPINSLTEAGKGTFGPDSGFAYEWVKQTGEKVWVVNAAHGGSAISSWQPNATNFKEAVLLFSACQETLRKEIAAGHFTLSHMGYFWCQGCSDATMTAQQYVEKYLAMHNGLKSALTFDHDSNGSTPDVGFEFAGIIPVRAAHDYFISYREGVYTDTTTASYYESFKDLRFNGPRVAQYWMANNPDLPDIWNVCNIGEDWVWMPDGTNGVTEYFQSHYENGTVDYTTQVKQSASWYTPTTPKAVHDSIHYNQIGYNEVGRESARNALIMLGEIDAPNVETEVKFMGWDGYSEVTMVDAYTKGRSETLVVPKVYPVWKSKEVTYTLTDGLIWDYYDLLVENDGVGGMLSAEGMSDTVTVTGHTWSEWVTLFEPSAEGPGQQQRVCSHCGKTDSRTVDGVWQIYDLADHLLELPEGICGETNLWPMLPHEDVHFTSGKKWGVTSTPTTSITIPVEAGDRIYATSWNKAGENGHATSDGIRLTFFDSKGIAQTLGPGESYRLFAANGGYLVAPEGSIAVNIVMWYDSVEYEVYILNREHTYTPAITAPTCTEQGYTTYTCACGDSYVSEHTAPTGHAYGEWKTTKDATFTEDGEESHACTKCSHVEFRAVPLTVVTSGNLGYGTQPTDAVIYTLYSNGTMVVEGTGVLFDCYWDGRNQPFIDYRSQIKHLIIGEGVTSTRGGCFAHLKNLETVQLPSTLTSLSKNAFMSSFVESVTEFTIPASVTNLGSYSLGHYGGDASAYFTDIIIENPNIKITDEKAVFNGGSKLDKLTLYSYGNDNAVRAYAEKYGIAYIDLDSYAFGSVGEVNYRIYNGVLTIYTDGENVVIPANDLPWNAYKDTITRIVIQDGITVISENAFTDYPVLEEVVLPECLVSIGNSAFSVTNGTSANLHIALPKRIQSLGTHIFAGRAAVNVTAYYGSIAAELNEENIELSIIKQFKILFIGNSFSEDATSGSHTTDSQLLDILRAMLGEDAEIIVGLCYSGGKGINWHATQAEQGNRNYSFKVITSENGQWKGMGSYTSAEALAWTAWDVVSLQHYEINTTTGEESNAYPEQVDPKFHKLEAATEFMLDHVDHYAPDAKVYFYMHWSRAYKPNLNESLATYNKMASFFLEVLDYSGPESGQRFETIVPVGLSIQNARTTYLALLSYNTSAYNDGNLNLTTDAQIGLQRDGGHLSFNIGRYIAALTFAEMVIPEEMRAEGYVLPDIRITESIGKLPKEYTTIAQKAVHAAVENWKVNGSLNVSAIEGYEKDPTEIAKETLAKLMLNIPCAGNLEELAERIRTAVLAALPTDFAVEKVSFADDFALSADAQILTVTVTLRFGYTPKDVQVSISLGGKHAYTSVVTAPTCTEQGYTTYTCACGDSYEDDYVDATGKHTYENGICTGCGAMLGDLNCDGLVNSDDLTLLARHVARIESVTGTALANADVNGDGVVTSDDLTKHARYVARIITSWDQE